MTDITLRAGSGDYVGYLVRTHRTGSADWLINPNPYRTDLYAPRNAPGAQDIQLTLGDFTYFSKRGDARGVAGEGVSGTTVLQANEANAILNLYGPGDVAYAASGGPPVATFIAFVTPVSPPAPPDPLVTIGSVGATAIRVVAAAPLNIATPVAVAMSANYTRRANFPAPVGTSPGAILNGTTKLFYAPEAAALVAAGAGTYA
jgi:hypothetical protein